jgi:hypothetical protein
VNQFQLGLQMSNGGGGGLKSADNSPQAYGEQDCEFVSTWTPLVKVCSDPAGHQAPPSRGEGLVQVLCLQKTRNTCKSNLM